MKENIWLEPPDDPQELARAISLLSSDITVFAHNVFAAMGWNKDAPLSIIEEDVIKYASDHTQGRVRIVCAFRMLGKTTLIGGVLVPFRLFNNADFKTVIVSKSDDFAVKILGLCRKVIQNCWFLQHMMPTPQQRDNQHEFDVADSRPGMAPSISSVGIGGHLSGRRANLVIGDDIEDPNNILTREARDRLEDNTREFKAWLYDSEQGDGPEPEIVYVCTFHHIEDSLYLRLAKRGISIRCWPIRYPMPGEKTYLLAPLMQERLDSGLAKPGEPSCPLRFGTRFIAEREAEGHVWFQMQYMLSVQIPDAESYELRLSDLIVMPLDREYVPSPVTWAMRDHTGPTDCTVPVMLSATPYDRLLRPAMLGQTLVRYSGTKAAVDIAGMSGRDQAALCVTSMASGMFFTRYLQGIEAAKDGGHMNHDGAWIDGPHDVIAKTCRDYSVSSLYFERNADPTGTWGQLMQAAIVRHTIQPGEHPLYPDGWACSLYPVHSTGQKETRIIDSLRQIVGSHRLVVDESVVRPTKHPTNKQFQHQFARIKREKGCLDNDDLVDALAMSIKAWTDVNLSLTKDPKKAAEDGVVARIDEMKQKLKRAVNEMLGKKPEPSGWRRR